MRIYDNGIYRDMTAEEIAAMNQPTEPAEPTPEERLAALETTLSRVITTKRMQSDKLGFDWLVYYIKDTEVCRVYEPQATPAGTADNPISWSEGMSLISNAYYTYDGARKVWTGDAGTVAGWDDDGWEIF